MAAGLWQSPCSPQHLLVSMAAAGVGWVSALPCRGPERMDPGLGPPEGGGGPGAGCGPSGGHVRAPGTVGPRASRALPHEDSQRQTSSHGARAAQKSSGASWEALVGDGSVWTPWAAVL